MSERDATATSPSGGGGSPTDGQDGPKVLYVTSRFPSLTATFIANEMAAVDAAGAEVHVASLWAPLPGHSGHPVEVPFLDRVVAFDMRKARTWRSVASAIRRRPSVLRTIGSLVPGHLSSPWLFAKLIGSVPRGLFYGEWAATNDIDRLHAHFLTTPTTVALIAGHVADIPYSATAHAFDITSEDPRLKNGSVSLKCRLAESIITISEYNRHDILSRWPELASIRLEVIYNGIETAAFAGADDVRPLDHDGTVKVLTVSSLIEKKGHDYAIEAIAKLRAEGVDVRLDIYGEGPRKAILQQLIDRLNVADSVALRGAADQTEVIRLCRSADIFALACVVVASGDADGLPTVLIESLASSLPTISTQVTGVPEIVVDGETGLCVTPGDSDALANAVKWMIEHPDQARAYGKAGAELVSAQFERTGAAQRLLSTWSGS